MQDHSKAKGFSLCVREGVKYDTVLPQKQCCGESGSKLPVKQPIKIKMMINIRPCVYNMNHVITPQIKCNHFNNPFKCFT